MDTYKEENRRYFSFTVKNNKNIQVLQNMLNRLFNINLLNADYNTPTAELLHQTGSLSVHQTAVTTLNIAREGYIYRGVTIF